MSVNAALQTWILGWIFYKDRAWIIDYEAVKVTQEGDGALFSSGERIRYSGAFLLRL
jgi:hypothetical protein